jgi:hypothetical protein
MPESAWLTKLQVESTARDLRYDLAVDASGDGKPSLLKAGLIPLPNTGDGSIDTNFSLEVALLVGVAVTVDALSVAFVWNAIRGKKRSEV